MVSLKNLKHHKHHIPQSLKEALDVLSKNDCYIMAGGTDLMVIKHRRSGLLPNFDKDVLYISNLKELDYINVDKNGDLHIGAATKYKTIEKDERVPLLIREIVKEIASPNIRNMATMAGNIANASPAGDSLVGLYLLDAQLVLVSKSKTRTMPISEFIYGVRRIRRNPDELIKEIIIPHHDFTKTYWKKVGSRAAESISKITFAGAYTLDGDVVKELRIAYGSVSITVVRKPEIEKKYENIKIDELKGKIPAILEDYSEFVTPITDQRSTKDYRFKVAMNITKKFIEDIK